MQKILVDSGPLIALFDRDEEHHDSVVSCIKKNDHYSMATTWPVLTETSHLLDFDLNAQLDCLTWIDKSNIEIIQHSSLDLQHMIEYMSKYQDRPMDLADASLVLSAIQLETQLIITLDKDFLIYRLPHKK
ncbi:MAG: PIN domain-containing protein, partial [Deltaproteobacteria bacterium]|nr:PIN domain-containing protein [Deltaproteobacteria bacterium]